MPDTDGRKGRRFMARKHIDTIISSGILMCCVLLMASDVNAQSIISARKQQFQISGSVGVANVLMRGLPGTVVTDASGRFIATADYNWKGSVTPTLEGYQFTPPTRSVGPVKAHLDNYDFSGEIQMFVISGTTTLPNVTIHGFSKTVRSDPAGKFEVRVPYGTTLTVMPELEGYSFSPPSIDYAQVKRNYPAQRFLADKKRYTISGMVSSEGMALSMVALKIRGQTKEVRTGQDGRYAVEVTHGASVEITPVREGFTFYPEAGKYTDVTADDITNYDATQLRYAITGNVGVENAFIKYSGGNTLSDAEGNYSIELNHGIRLAITPEKEGYRFSPPELLHMKLTSSLVNQNFQAAAIIVTVSGNVGAPDVLMDGLIDISGQPVVSNAQGFYEAKVQYNSTLAVMPKKAGYTFTPASQSYPNLKEDQRAETYTAEAMLFDISGNVGVRNVSLKGLNGRFVSDPAGGYRVQVPFDWTGTITPELAGYEFDPPSKFYQNVQENLYSNEDYTAKKKMYVISGLVSSPDGPVEGAEIRFGGLGGTVALTDSLGRYSLELEHGQSGKLSVGKEGYIFGKYSVDVQSIVKDREASFSGKLRTLKISGRLMYKPTPDSGEQPLSEVRLTADNGGAVTVSDPQGRWTVEVPYNWSGQISMEKPGMEIDDVFPFSNVIDDIDLTKPEPSVPVARPVNENVRPPVDPVPTPRVDRTENAVPTGTPKITDDFFPSEKAFDALNSVDEIATTESRVAPGVQALRDELDALKQNLARKDAMQMNGEGKLIDRGPMVSTQSFQEEDLSSVLALIGDEVGVSIIADSGVLDTTSVSWVDPIPLEQALDMLVAGTNYSWMFAGDYYLVSTMSPDQPAFVSGTVTQRIKMGYISSQDAVSMLSTSMTRFVKAEPEGSYVTVTAGPKLTERIINDLRSFDVAPKQVLLQSKVVVMEEGDLLNMGVEWSWPKVSAGMFSSHYKGELANLYDTGGKGIWGVQMGYGLGNTFTNALTLGLNLLQENEKAQMIATPSTMASDGELARMSVVTEEYYMLTPQVEGSASLFSQSQMETIESGVTLEITPRIADNNDVILAISVELSDSIPSGRGSGLPVVTRRTAQNTVRIMNGGSAVIAGLNENRKNINEKRTPGLSRIPLLGKLFSNTNNDTASRDVAIFVTANIIKNEKPGARPINSVAPPANPVNQAPMPNMNNYPTGYMAPGATIPGAQYNPIPGATMPGTQYNAPPRAQYNNTPNINLPGTYDSFQAELRRTIAEQRRNNNTAFNN